jgi:rod shape-determining protein MreD
MVFVAAVGLAVIESVIMPSFEVAGIRPDLAVLVVVVASCRARFGRAMALAFALGLARDFFSAGPVGMNAFALTMTTYFLTGAEDYLLTENWKAQLFVVFLGYVVFGSLLFMGTLFPFNTIPHRYEVVSAVRVVQMIVGTAAYTGILAPLGFALSRKPETPSYRRLRDKYNVEHETLHQTEV